MLAAPNWILFFCVFVAVLLIKNGTQNQSEMSRIEKFIFSWTAVTGYALVISSLLHFSMRGHPLNNGLPYFLVTGFLIVYFNKIVCLALWPFAQINLTPKSLTSLASSISVNQSSVVVLVPTLGESTTVLRESLNACMNMDHSNFTLVVLDDGNRAEVRDLAQEIGCRYIARDNRVFAKAGNLNFGLSQTQSDLVVVFDADYIPERNFLRETLPWFEDRSVGIVQAPQFMRKAEPLGRALGVADDISESDIFYRFHQPVYDLFGAAICCGTACVFRRSSLADVGGFFCESSTEDYYTGIRITALGHRLVYIYRKLSTGLPAATLASYIDQRNRWARGTIQGLRTSSSPLTISGLRMSQRIGHFLSLSSWLSEPMNCALRFIGLGLAIAGTAWIQASWQEIAFSVLPVVLLTDRLVRVTQGNEIPARYAAVRAAMVDLTIARSVVFALLSPKRVEFRVSRKSPERSSSNRVGAGIFVMLAFMTLLYAWGTHSCLLALKPFLGIGLHSLWTNVSFYMVSSSLVYSLQGLIVNSMCIFIAMRR